MSAIPGPQLGPLLPGWGRTTRDVGDHGDQLIFLCGKKLIPF
jgi:hypothetical protein